MQVLFILAWLHSTVYKSLPTCKQKSKVVCIKFLESVYAPFSSGEIACINGMQGQKVHKYTNTMACRMLLLNQHLNSGHPTIPHNGHCMQTILNNLNLVTTHRPSARLSTVTAGITLKKCSISLFLAFSASVQQRL